MCNEGARCPREDWQHHGETRGTIPASSRAPWMPWIKWLMTSEVIPIEQVISELHYGERYGEICTLDNGELQ